MEKVAYIGDLHFSGSNYIQVGKAWSDTIDICIENKITTIFVLGDVFDSSNIASHRIPLGTIISSFNSPLLRAIDNNIVVYLLVGNHDLASSNHEHSLSYLKNMNTKIHIIDEPTILTLENKKIGILPWIQNKLINDEDFSRGVQELISRTFSSFSDNNIDILLGHIELSNYNLNNYRMVGNKYSIEPSRIKDVCKNIYLGHYHKGDDMYVGSLTHLTFNDCGNKHRFLIHEFTTNIVTEVNVESPEYKIIHIEQESDIPTELDTYNQYRLDIKESLDLDSVKHLLNNNIEIKVLKEKEEGIQDINEELVLNEIELFKKYASIKKYEDKNIEEVLSRLEKIIKEK